MILIIIVIIPTSPTKIIGPIELYKSPINSKYTLIFLIFIS